MRDGDVIGLLPTLERSQKYDDEISNWLVPFNTDSSVLQACHLYVSCTLVGRNHFIIPRVDCGLQKTSYVRAGTSNASNKRRFPFQRFVLSLGVLYFEYTDSDDDFDE